jgi:3-oxoacyl-[acyl-carrier-protein] synthase-3
MSEQVRMQIVGTGAYIPELRVPNSDFLEVIFFDSDQKILDKPAAEVVAKLEEITQITERRYAPPALCTSDIAALAAEEALQSSGIDRETLDFIIVAHNFGDVHVSGESGDMVPCIAARVKHLLGIVNPYSVAYDVIFGCPGWLQGMMLGNAWIRSGDGKRGLVIGAEILSRVSDPHDRNRMIFGDGAGATIVEAVSGNENAGFIKWGCRSDTLHDVGHLTIAESDNPALAGKGRFLKMNGRNLYKYALKTVPQEIANVIRSAGLTLHDISAVLIHQANAKMDEAILDQLKKIFNVPHDEIVLMPMTISWLGNSSVATVPTLLALMMRG